MKKFGFSFRILHPRNWKSAFHLPHVYILEKKHCACKWHGMFVSQHKIFHWKRTSDYEEICQVLSEQAHSQ